MMDFVYVSCLSVAITADTGKAHGETFGMEYIVYAFIWITVMVTIISGIIYVFSARKTLLAA